MSGHNLPNHWRDAAVAGHFDLLDPGDAGTIRTLQGVTRVPLVSGGAETRTLADPSSAGLLCTLEFVTDGGDITLTASTAYDQAGSTTVTFDDAGDYVTFLSVASGSTFVWRVVGYDGVTGPDEQEVNTFTAGISVGTTLTLQDAANVVANTSTGSKIGTAVGQKIGFWNATPIVQPSGAAQADQGAMTTVGSNSGTAGAGLSLIGDTTSVNQASNLMNDLVALQEDITALDTLVTAIRTALVDAGLMKGAA